MQAIKIAANRQIGDRIQNHEDERRLTMTSKEMLVELIERLPEELVHELQHYAEYLYLRSQHEEWSEISLAHLAARYIADEVEYTMDDLK
jgi:uncharacterized protein DUF2281